MMMLSITPSLSGQKEQEFASPRKLLSFAQNLLDKKNLGKLDTLYSHKNKATENKLHFNCYGFINYLLSKTHPQAQTELCERMHALESQDIPVSIDGTPCPFHYKEILAFGNLFHWALISVYAEIKPGDLLIYTPRSYQPPLTWNGKKTGTHIMVVKSTQQQGEEHHLRIIDFTGKPHNKTDSRIKSPRSGLGESTLHIRLDEQKKGLLRWGSDHKWYKKDIVVARILDN